MGQFFACFKAYDVRGRVPEELNEDLAYAIGRAYVEVTGAKKVCVGHDIRLSGPSLSVALAKGLNDAGCDVVDLGLIGTEIVYFATAHYGLDGGVMITASHNPPQDNGMKIVRSESRPISSDTGLGDIEKRAHEHIQSKQAAVGTGTVTNKDCYADFVQHLLEVCPGSNLRDFKVLASAGNGAAGLAMDALAPHLPLQVTRMMFEPDGNFPNGVPNPILPESRAKVTAEAATGKYDLAVAWDGDYDRCFFLDEKGNFIEGYYIVGLLAAAILQDNPGAAIIYDPRLTWNTIDVVEKAGGVPVMCKSGHAFIKEMMRSKNAVYGGEMSAHHYFRSNWFCDSGMIPMLLVLKLMKSTGKSLGDLVGDMIAKYPCSGEVNRTVPDVKTVLERVRSHYPDGKIDTTDGLSLEFETWRFNLRGSNTEPVIRLNVETRGDADLCRRKTDELLALIEA